MPLTNEQLLHRITQLESRLRAFTEQRVSNLIQVAPLAMTKADGYSEQVENRLSDDDVPRGVRRMQHAGFRSRPLDGTDALFVLCEGGAVKAVVISEGDNANVTLDSGEAAVYSPAEPTCIITMKKDGTIILKGKDVSISASGKINAHAPSGEIVIKGSKVSTN